MEHLGVDGDSTRGLGGGRGALDGRRDRMRAVRGVPVDATLHRLKIPEGAGRSLTPVTVFAQPFACEILLLAVAPIRADVVDHRLLRAGNVLFAGDSARKLVEVCQRLRKLIKYVCIGNIMSFNSMFVIFPSPQSPAKWSRRNKIAAYFTKQRLGSVACARPRRYIAAQKSMGAT